MSADTIIIKKPFFPLKTNKYPSYDEISSNVIKNCFSELNDPLKCLFEKSYPYKVKNPYPFFPVFLKFWSVLCITVFTNT